MTCTPHRLHALCGLALLACVTPEPSTNEAGESTTTETGTETETGEPEPLPNIDLRNTASLVEDSLWTTLELFEPDHCAVIEGCITPGPRRLLRFSSYVPNVGTADYVIGSPALEPERFEWSPCHEHWHLSDFIDYRLLDGQGSVVASGHKMAFSLMDQVPWVVEAEPGKYPLDDGTQGISVGWVDAYTSLLDCQWIDITGVAPGDYQLELVVNTFADVPELDDADNVLTIPVTLTDTNSGPPGIPDSWTCAPAAYGGDQCNCGCGAFDPDCSNPTITACEVCDAMGSCAEGDPDCSTIAPNDNTTCE